VFANTTLPNIHGHSVVLSLLCLYSPISSGVFVHPVHSVHSFQAICTKTAPNHPNSGKVTLLIYINNQTSVKDASTLSGYSMQYIRRLLRLDRLEGIKIGQVWLVEINSLDEYLNHALKSDDQRYSPRY
jgi:hypothetical protein